MANPTEGDVRFPDVHVQLTGEGGNVFSVIGRVRRALRTSGVAQDEIDEFTHQIMATTDYDEALRICMHWVQTS